MKQYLMNLFLKETLHQNYEHINNLLSTVSPKVVNDNLKI